MKVLSWNIRQGGGRRTAGIVAAIRKHEPDVVCINEFRERPGAILRDELSKAGLCFVAHNQPAGLEYGILVAAKNPIRRLSDNKPSSIVRRGLLEVVLSDETIIGAMYGPMLTPEHGPFWDAVVEHGGQVRDRSYLLLGDFNTGEAGVDCHKSPFAGSKQFLQLRELGFQDLWRAHNPNRTEYTWRSVGRGGVPLNGFRIDHALATPSLAQRTTGCWYSHIEREEKLSDHSVLLVELSTPIA